MNQIEIECKKLKLNHELRHYQNNLSAFNLNTLMGNDMSQLAEWTKVKLEEVKNEIEALQQ